jgi:hypothetical protein
MEAKGRFVLLSLVLALAVFGIAYHADAQSAPTYDQYCSGSHGSASIFGPKTITQITNAIV